MPGRLLHDFPRTRMISPCRIAVFALAVAAFLGAAAPASADRLEIGVQDDAVFVSGSGIGREAGLDRARQMGATHAPAGGGVGEPPPAAPTSTSRSPPPSLRSRAGWPVTSAAACSATR